MRYNSLPYSIFTSNSQFITALATALHTLAMLIQIYLVLENSLSGTSLRVFDALSYVGIHTDIQCPRKVANIHILDCEDQKLTKIITY